MAAVGLLAAVPVSSAEAAADRTPPRIVSRPTKGWKQRGDIHDVTHRFRADYDKAVAGTLARPRAARGFVVLVVPGAAGNQVPGYFRATEAHLRGRGYEVARARVNTLDDVDANGVRIADQIEEIARAGKDVVLLTHSKGGPDALAAEALRPAIRGHIRARVLMQPADGGVPGAQLLDNPVARAGFRILRAQGGLLKDLSPHRRREMNSRRPHDLTIPTLVLATSADRGLRGVIGRVVVGRAAKRGSTDGMVPRWAQLIRGTHAVILDDMDHGEPVFTLPGRHYEPGPLAESMITTALQLPRAR